MTTYFYVILCLTLIGIGLAVALCFLGKTRPRLCELLINRKYRFPNVKLHRLDYKHHMVVFEDCGKVYHVVFDFLIVRYNKFVYDFDEEV